MYMDVGDSEIKGTQLKATAKTDVLFEKIRALSGEAGEDTKYSSTIHRIRVIIVIGVSDEDPEEGFDVAKDIYVRDARSFDMSSSSKQFTSFSREIPFEWKENQHNVQDLKTSDLFCGKIVLKLI